MSNLFKVLTFIDLHMYLMIWISARVFVHVFYSIVFIQGTLPSDADGEVSRTACIVGFSGPCSRIINIRIKSCGEYRVYHLLPVPQTTTAYCIGINIYIPTFFYEKHINIEYKISKSKRTLLGCQHQTIFNSFILSVLILDELTDTWSHVVLYLNLIFH